MDEWRKILVVDDDEAVLSLIGRIAKSHGASVEIAHDGKEALLALSGSERFDAIILDLRMPGVTGWDVLACIEKDSRMAYVPIIVISGAELSIEEKTELSNRVTAFVDKEDFDIREFEALLDQVLDFA